MKNNLFSFIFLFCFSQLAMNQTYPPSHDPSRMIKNVDGRYWIFTTGDGIWCMSSSNTNFTDWRAETTPYTKTNWPSWINNYVSGFTGCFWAPDIIKVGSKYYLYYSCAGSGTAAAIGLTTATDLRGPWTDQGMVYAGNNAIDPAIYYDGTQMWMVWGNWVEGIDICELDPTTGKRKNSTKTKLVTGQVEGPYLIKNGSYYYLFYQRGLCCQGVNSTYFIVVARSTSITGPYTDERVFLSTNGRFIGPGHIGYGEGKLTYHFYDGNDNGNAKLMITTLTWSNGWPVAGTSTTTIVNGGTYRITARHSYKVLDLQNCNTSDGGNVQQWSSLNNDCQRWIFTDVGSGYWRISPAVATAKALDVTNCGTSNGINIQIWNWLNNDCQKWQLVNLGNGYYQIKSKISGKCLDVANASKDDGANVIQYTCNTSSTNQHFVISWLKSTNDNILENVKYTNLNIYPNPASNKITIEIPEKYVSSGLIDIYDQTGRKLLTIPIENKSLINIDISKFSNGIYIVQIKNNNDIVIQKLIKK